MEKRDLVAVLAISLFLVLSILSLGSNFSGTGYGIKEVLAVINAPVATLATTSSTTPFCTDALDSPTQVTGKFFINYNKKGVCND